MTGYLYTFKVNHTYGVGWRDHFTGETTHVSLYTITKRTAKTVTVYDHDRDMEYRVKVRMTDVGEFFKPYQTWFPCAAYGEADQ